MESGYDDGGSPHAAGIDLILFADDAEGHAGADGKGNAPLGRGVCYVAHGAGAGYAGDS